MIILEDIFTRKVLKNMMIYYYKSRRCIYILRIFLGIYFAILFLDSSQRLSWFFSFEKLFTLILSIFSLWFILSGYKYWSCLTSFQGIYTKIKKDSSLIVRYTIDSNCITREIPSLNKKYVLSWEKISRVESNEFYYYLVSKPFSRYFIIRKECFSQTAITSFEELIEKSFHNTKFY